MSAPLSPRDKKLQKVILIAVVVVVAIVIGVVVVLQGAAGVFADGKIGG